MLCVRSHTLARRFHASTSGCFESRRRRWETAEESGHSNEPTAQRRTCLARPPLGSSRVRNCTGAHVKPDDPTSRISGAHRVGKKQQRQAFERSGNVSQNVCSPLRLPAPPHQSEAHRPLFLPVGHLCTGQPCLSPSRVGCAYRYRPAERRIPRLTASHPSKPHSTGVCRRPWAGW